MQKLIWTTIFLMAFSLPAWAQESFVNTYCSDYHGLRVKIVADSSARKISGSGILAGGNAVIRINARQLSGLSENARLFALNYSCARLTLGHLVKGAEDVYQHFDQVGNADCWAASKLFYSGRINLKGVEALEEEINGLNREQWSHFPGPVRVVSLKDSCSLKPLN